MEPPRSNWGGFLLLDIESQFKYFPLIMKTLTKRPSKYVAFAVLLVAVIAAGSMVHGQTQTSSGGSRQLMVYGDTVFFIGPGIPGSCSHSSQFKHGDNIGFRMTAINPETGKRDRATQLVVHITYGGKTVDLPMHDRQNDRQPEREFWIAKWPVPDDATTGIVRYTVTAKDPQGRTGEYKPFDVNESQITIVAERTQITQAPVK
jgi:hypothetical protein